VRITKKQLQIFQNTQPRSDYMLDQFDQGAKYVLRRKEGGWRLDAHRILLLTEQVRGLQYQLRCLQEAIPSPVTEDH